MPTRPAGPCSTQGCPNRRPCPVHNKPWAGSTRRRRLPPDWPAIRARIQRRAGGRCEATLSGGRRCPLPGSQCDHVQRGDDHSDSNLQWLCTDHHATKSGSEGRAAQL